MFGVRQRDGKSRQCWWDTSAAYMTLLEVEASYSIKKFGEVYDDTAFVPNLNKVANLYITQTQPLQKGLSLLRGNPTALHVVSGRKVEISFIIHPLDRRCDVHLVNVSMSKEFVTQLLRRHSDSSVLE